MYYDIYMLQYIVYVYVGLYNDIIILYLLCVFYNDGNTIGYCLYWEGDDRG